MEDGNLDSGVLAGHCVDSYIESCNLGGYFEATRAHDWYEYLLSVLHSNVPVILIVPVHGIYED